MRRFQISPLVRGLLIVAGIALVVMIFKLYAAVFVVSALLRIAFFLAIAFFVYMWWRDRRGEIDLWAKRSRIVFYGAAALVVVDLAAFFWPFRDIPLHGFSALSFVFVIGICGYSMWRVWRDEHTFGG
jgi:hypothetical protein